MVNGQKADTFMENGKEMIELSADSDDNSISEFDLKQDEEQYKFKKLDEEIRDEIQTTKSILQNKDNQGGIKGAMGTSKSFLQNRVTQNREAYGKLYDES